MRLPSSGEIGRASRLAFLKHLTERFARLDAVGRGGTVISLVRALRRGDVEVIMTDLRVFFAQIPYDLQLPRESGHWVTLKKTDPG